MLSQRDGKRQVSSAVPGCGAAKNAVGIGALKEVVSFRTDARAPSRYSLSS
jgi:hypothetical protein